MTLADLADFPFPLTSGAYRYTANLQPGGQRQEQILFFADDGDSSKSQGEGREKEGLKRAGAWGEAITRVGPDYAGLIAERARILHADPGRLIRDPALQAAEWDTLRYLMRRLAAEYPAGFHYSETGGKARWENRLLGTSIDFTPGEPATLPCGPLEFIGRQVVEDLVLLDEREGHLWADAGLVTFASGWSFPFVAGSSFQEIHGPVPRANADGVFARAEAFLMRLQPGQAYRRVNWAFQPFRVLDHSMDAAATWMPEAASFLATATDEDIAREVHLRVELQHLIRLETSAAVLFLIDTRFLSLADLARVPEWSARLLAVLTDLPDDIADYKGLRHLRPRVIDCLARSRHHPRL